MMWTLDDAGRLLTTRFGQVMEQDPAPRAAPGEKAGSRDERARRWSGAPMFDQRVWAIRTENNEKAAKPSLYMRTRPYTDPAEAHDKPAVHTMKPINIQSR